MLDGFGHVSIRNPSQSDHYFMTCDNLGGADRENYIVELDLDSNPCNPNGSKLSLERFIHGEIYRARPDVNAIVHTHSPALIPFGVSKTPLQPLYHMCGFLAEGAPIFDIQLKHGMTNMLVQSNELGRSLALSLGKSAVVLMRGHGATIVGSSVKEAVYRAIYLTINANLQPIAMQLGTPKFLDYEEAVKAEELHRAILNRPWDYWKSRL
ncbi:MAG: putative Class aldolase/adducin-like protein [Gammaproteobacteria bacterium]|nr:putative Class aldolase/adducin-like protein [Gammaproteobacteria bacterium]